MDIVSRHCAFLYLVRSTYPEFLTWSGLGLRLSEAAAVVIAFILLGKFLRRASKIESPGSAIKNLLFAT